jgi:hypothetical protein
MLETLARPWQGVLDIMLCHEVYQGLALGQLFSLGTPVSYANKVQIGLKLKFFLVNDLFHFRLLFWKISK